MLILTETPLYIKILYGIWVVIILVVYVVFGGILAAKQDDNKDEREFGLANENGGYWKSQGGRISLSPPSSESFGPSKLSKEVINEKSFIQIRKKSVDMLETPFNTARNTSPRNSGRQRKISNVHFGPVVAEQFSPVVPNTPNNTISNTNFGFGDKKKYTDESDDSNDKEEEIDGDQEETEDEDHEEEEEEEYNEQEVRVEGSANDHDSQNDEKVCFTNDDNNEETRKSVDSLASLPSMNGSIRITRHSTRAHTKASEIFQRSSSFSRPNHITPSISVSSETPLVTSPPIGRSLSFSPQCPTTPVIHACGVASSKDDDDNQDNETPRCPFRRSPLSDSSLPLHERRQRRTGLEMQLPKPDNLSIGRTTPARSPSRSPSFSRK